MQLLSILFKNINMTCTLTSVSFSHTYMNSKTETDVTVLNLYPLHAKNRQNCLAALKTIYIILIFEQFMFFQINILQHPKHFKAGRRRQGPACDD